MVERTDLHTHRTAVVLVEIGKTEFILDKSDLTVLVFYRIIIKSLRWTLLMADPAIFTVLPDPAMCVGFALW